MLLFCPLQISFEQALSNVLELKQHYLYTGIIHQVLDMLYHTIHIIEKTTSLTQQDKDIQ